MITGTSPIKKSPVVPSPFRSLEGVKVKVPALVMVIVPTFGIVAVLPALNVPETPEIVKEVKVMVLPS